MSVKRSIQAASLVWGVVFGSLTAKGAEVVDMRKAFRSLSESVVVVEFEDQRADSAAAVRGLPSPRIAVRGDDGKFEFIERPISPTPQVDKALRQFELAIINNTNAPMCSGTIVSADGLIVTTGVGNKKATVKLSDGRSFDAAVVVYDEANDSTIYKIDASDLRAVSLSDSAVELGQPVGMALRLDKQTRVDAGIVTGEHRWNASTMNNCFESNLTCPVGSSGAPVVDAEGNLVGIVRAIRAANPMMQSGPSYIMAAEDIQRLLDAVPESGTTTLKRGMIGMQLADNGTVQQVLPESPAEDAGIKAGDKVLSIAEQAVASAEDILGEVRRFRSGDSVAVKILREEEEIDLEMKLMAADTPRRVNHTPEFRLQPAPAPRAVFAPQTPQRYTPVTPFPPVPEIQVQRSNLEKSIQQLQKQLKELQSQLKEQSDDDSDEE